MKALLLVLASLLLFSCRTAPRRISLATLPLPAAVDNVRRPAAKADREDSPDEAAEFYVLKRTGGAPLPVERLLEARRLARLMPLYSLPEGRFVSGRAKSTPRDANVGTWQPLGPGNIGGRTRALVIRPDDPNTMYAGSVGGGVWKTTDGGNSWNPLTDLLPSIGISTLAMDPQNPDTLYAGTGEWYTNSQRGDSIRGAGIFKTDDAGATWTALPATTTSSFYYTNKIVVSPNNSQHIYAATYGGVWFSPDAGATWRRVLNRTGSLLGCQDLAIRTDQPTDYLFAACAVNGTPNPAIYRNVDAAGSGTWDIVFTTQNLARTSLALAPSNQGIIYAAASSSETGDYNNGLLGIFRSTSNGDPGTWETRVSNTDANRLNTVLFTNPRDAFADICSNEKASLTNQGDYDNVIAVDPLNPDIVWVGGIDLFRSDDGGQTWGIAAFWQANPPQMAHADKHAIAFAPGYNGSDNQTLFAASDGGIYRTDNALASTAKGDRAACAPYPAAVAWTDVNNGYAVTQFYHGAVYPGGGAYVGGTQDNNTVFGSDAAGPLAWSTVFRTGDGGFVAIDPTDPNVWYSAGKRGGMNAPTDGGLNRTTNGGASFSSANKGITEDSSNFLFIAPFVMDPSEPKRLYTGGKTLWRTTDGAQNWFEASSAIATNSGAISAIAVSPTDPNRVVFGTSTGFVFRNANALGADRNTAWASSQPRTGYLSRLAFDPTNPDIVYATYSQYKQNASQSHAYQSADGGATWNGIDGSGATGLPDIPVFSIISDPQNPSNLYLGTDIGLFVSLDSGATWARDDNAFADAVTETLVLDRSAGQSVLYAFTHGRGVWRTVLPGSGDRCQYSASTNSLSFPAYPGTASVNLTTGDNCAWSVISRNSFFRVDSPAGGHGTGTFTTKTAFINNSERTVSSNVVVQDTSVAVTQDAARVASGNDDVSSPFPMGTLPAVVIENTSSATESPNDPVHSCTKSADFKTLWFALAAPGSGTILVTLINRRADNGRDAGTVMSVYRVTNGVIGPEFGCRVIAQSAIASGFQGLQWAAKQGDVFLIEVSATTSGAPAGASVLGGNLTITATLTP